MPRCGLLLVILAAATLGTQLGSSQSTPADPSQTRPPSHEAPTPKAAPRVIALEPSPIPRSLAKPERGLDSEALAVLRAISLCDPVACLGDGPQVVIVDGNWRLVPRRRPHPAFRSSRKRVTNSRPAKMPPRYSREILAEGQPGRL
jgi:hypothetical protein